MKKCRFFVACCLTACAAATCLASACGEQQAEAPDFDDVIAVSSMQAVSSQSPTIIYGVEDVQNILAFFKDAEYTAGGLDESDKMTATAGNVWKEYTIGIYSRKYHDFSVQVYSKGSMEVNCDGVLYSAPSGTLGDEFYDVIEECVALYGD